MATGDKIYIADKITLDSVNTKVGSSGDTGATTTTGSLFAKINSLTSRVAAFVANWTEARAAKVDNLDAAVSSRQSEANASTRYNTLNTNTGVNNTASATGTLSQKLSHAINTVNTRQSEADAATRYNQLNTNTAINNTASATGTLSQKLSHIIGLFTTMKQKVLVSKFANIRIESVGTHTLLNVTGGGMVEFIWVSSMGNSNAPLTITVDGVPQVFNNLSGDTIFAQTLRNPGMMWSALSSQYTANEIGSMARPVHFKNSLVITVNTSDTYAKTFRAHYAVYE